MLLEAFRVSAECPEIAPCRPDRAWMDATGDRHAYRCLPLAVANCHGWELRLARDVSATWNGKPGVGDLHVAKSSQGAAESNFGSGILTFHTGHLFRTPPGWNLLVTGPFNEPWRDLAPLTGVVESDWLAYPFTMNWIFTAAGTVHWPAGQAFCMVFPVPKGLDQWEVRMRDLGDDEALAVRYRDMLASRQANPSVWQKHYFLGRDADGTAHEHVHKLRLQCPK